jgi:hypothetical protein
MRNLLLAGTMLGVGLMALPALSQTAAPAQPGAPAPAVCPEGQARGPDGSCTVTLPATPHQKEVLEPAAGPTSPAAGAATTGAPAAAMPKAGDMPATPHQQDVLKPKGGG